MTNIQNNDNDCCVYNTYNTTQTICTNADNYTLYEKKLLSYYKNMCN